MLILQVNRPSGILKRQGMLHKHPRCSHLRFFCSQKQQQQLQTQQDIVHFINTIQTAALISPVLLMVTNSIKLNTVAGFKPLPSINNGH